MIVKDIICTVCGRTDIFSPLKNDTNYNSLDEENFINKNFNQNLNNISSINNDPKYQYNPIEKSNINDNSIYSIDNFEFFIINVKNETSINKNTEGEINNYYKKVMVKKKLGRKTKRSADSTNGDGNATNSNKKEKIYDRFSDDNMRKSKKTLF